jgi:hypothetical protein
MSKEVKRYEPASGHDSVMRKIEWMREADDGGWVSWDDYEALRLELAEANADFVRIANEREALIAERDRLKEALERFYNANQTRLKLLSRDVYLDMQRLPGMRDALYEMDDAQHQAFAALQGEQP